MTHRVRSAFGRFLALGAVAVLATFVAVAPAAAQQTSGKIEGTVTDQAGVSLANAQVFVVGTSFGAVTNDKGYYFINSVPVGSYTLRAQFIGYAPTEVHDVRVLAGQTITMNVKLTPSAVQLTVISVEAANPIVPRDQVTSKTSTTGQEIRRLPVENLRSVLDLQPGVVESGKQKGVSIRGGRPGEAATYVDGVLVRNTQRGFAPLEVGTNSVEEASVTTGALGAEFGDAQSGIFSIVTRAGGQKYSGAFSFQSDDVGNLWNNVGYNRVEANFGGPVMGNLTFQLGGTLTGQKSLESEAGRDKDRPIFVASGVDTVVTQPNTVGADPTDSVSIAIPRFVQYSGNCGAYGAATNASLAPLSSTIRSNYGVSCQGLRQPFSANGVNTLDAKLQYTYGQGSRVSLSGLYSLNQSRLLTLGELYNPNNRLGNTATSYAGILNWTQNLARSSERAMAIDVNVSYQLDQNIQGPLIRQTELDSRDPFGGFQLKPYNYLLDFNSTHDVTIAGKTFKGVHYLDDAQINCVLAGEGFCQNDVANLNDNDLNSVMPYRLNPYGVEQSNRFSLWNSGLDQSIDLSREARWQVRANFDWQADRYNRVKVGGEFHRFDTRRFQDGSGMNSSFGLNAYHEKPVRYGAYAEDRLDLGDVVIVGGLRYDYFDTKALFPFTPGRIQYSGPDANGVRTNANFDPLNPEAQFVAAQAHHTFSPRIQVSFPVTENTNFRLSYAHQVQVPDFDLVFRGISTDLANTNNNQIYGRDLGFGKTIIFEFGVRHAFGQDMVLDVSAYNKDKVADLSGRLQQLIDPTRPAGPPGEYNTSDFRVLTNLDYGNVRGVDVRLERRFSNLFSGAVSYTLQVAKNTGSDPFSYTNLLARQISSLTGQTSPPPQAILPTDDNRTHNIVGSAALSIPGDWHQGTTLGKVLQNVGAFVTFRFSSGLPYTLVKPAEDGLTPGGCGLECTLLEPVNTSTMPWYRNVDLRVTKGFRLGRIDWTAFAEAKNVFDFKNIVSLFTEVGDVVYPAYQAKYLGEQEALLQNEANDAGILVAGNAVDFTALGGCQNWVGRNNGGFSSGPVDCVLLQRAEARYGNGDGVFTQPEYDAAFSAWYNLANAPSRFYGAGRRLRLGAEISF